MRKWILALCALSIVGCASKDKEKADLYLRMGASQLESGNYPAALRDLLKAEELNSSDPVVQNNLGLVYFFRERYDLSEKHLRKAIDLEPKYTEARNNLSRVLIEEGKYAEAESELKIVLNDLTYGSPEKAYVNFGLAKFNQKDYSAARSAFSKVLSSQPDDCIANTYFGRTFFETQDYSRATEALDRAIGFCQKNLYDEPHYFSALAYYRLGDKSKAIARFEEIVKYYPTGKYREKAKGMLSLIRKGHG
ncbi:tetratricopeptide repeat protein [Bdellovibrio sp. 22V]|uniref:tetratricopeptide repeat protein n=1 Tax=Bdellovibrio TaxID=958 RepID=UPI002542CFF9|nr:tetratricopeptide repeat protein [Bdellovibrio sp. 22V]WII72756.1 tetratricopeptide repeat protein [Bdellovibrio sp. 22V]